MATGYDLLVIRAHNLYYSEHISIFFQYRGREGYSIQANLDWVYALTNIIIPIAKEADELLIHSENRRLISVRYRELGDSLRYLNRYGESFASHQLSYEYAIKALLAALDENDIERARRTIDEVIYTLENFRDLAYFADAVDTEMSNRIMSLIAAFTSVQYEIALGEDGRLF